MAQDSVITRRGTLGTVIFSVVFVFAMLSVAGLVYAMVKQIVPFNLSSAMLYVIGLVPIIIVAVAIFDPIIVLNHFWFGAILLLYAVGLPVYVYFAIGQSTQTLAEGLSNSVPYIVLGCFLFTPPTSKAARFLVPFYIPEKPADRYGTPINQGAGLV